MIFYIKKRLFSLIFVLIGVTVFSFILSNIAPIDPSEAYVRRKNVSASEEQIEAMRKEMGFDLPIHKQYFIWVGNAVKGDFGESYTTGVPVIKEIAHAFPYTLKLVGVALLIIIILVIPISMLCVRYKNSFFDNFIRIITLIGISTSNFWLGFIVLYFFAVVLNVVNVLSYGKMENVLLPAITFAIPIAAFNIRVLRANMLENVNKDHIIYAKARGIPNRILIYKHVFKNSLPPVITLFGQTVGYMIAGTAIIENVFSWPGLGNYALKAIIDRNLPAINAFVLIMGVVFVICNLLADILNMYINPLTLKKMENYK